MDFAKLQIFYTVANISNISTASEQLHMSRQNISKVLRQLEQELDCQLLVRTSSGVRLTEKGALFLEYISQLRELTASFRQQLADVKAVSYSLLICYQFQQSINELFNDCPEDVAALNLFNSDANSINSCLKNTPRELTTYDLILSCSDGKFLRTLPPLSDFSLQELVRQPIGVIISKQHPLSLQYAPDQAIAPEALLAHSLIAMTDKLTRTPVQVQLIQNHYSDFTVSRLSNDLAVFRDGILSAKYYGFSDLYGFYSLFSADAAQWHPLEGEPIELTYFCLIQHSVRQSFRDIFLSRLEEHIQMVLQN